MKKRFRFLLGLCFLLAGCAPQPQTFTLLLTGDLHGQYQEPGARVIAHARQLIEAQGRDHVLLVDVGDMLQGTPAIYYANTLQDTTEQHLAAQYFNYLPYDAVTVGNHDIEVGKDVMTHVYGQYQMPVVCANVLDAATGLPFFTPYTVLHRQGYKIVIVGFTTDFVVNWVPSRLRPGLTFESVTESARKWVAQIRAQEKPDLLIGLIHSGLEGGQTSSAGPENVTEQVARQIAGFDLICYGHDHRAYTGRVATDQGDSVLLLNAGARGRLLGEATIRLQRKAPAQVQAAVISLDTLQPDAPYLAHVAPFYAQVEAYQNTPIAVLTTAISNVDAGNKGPCAYLDEVHRFQLDMAGEGTSFKADISVTAPLSQHSFQPGTLLVKDFFNWYPYENALCLVRMTGQELVSYLEYSYAQPRHSFNFDSAAGIIYTVDDSRPQGERIHVLRMADGHPFVLEKTYLVAMNSYRANGGGGHLGVGLGWSAAHIEEQVVWAGQHDLRSSFMQWESQRSPLSPESLGQWKYL